MEPVEYAQAGLARVVALVDAATIATDASLGNVFDVTLTASRTMGAPTNPSNGQKIEYRITQGGTGSYTIAWDPIFRFSTDLPSLTLSTAVGALDRAVFEYNTAAVKWDCVAKNFGY